MRNATDALIIYLLLSADGYLDDYLDSQSLESTWSELKPCGDGSEWPSMRGAHQLCFESCSQLIYLHGGWDGTKELGDLWTYSVAKGLWQCVYRDTSLAVSDSGFVIMVIVSLIYCCRVVLLLDRVIECA